MLIRINIIFKVLITVVLLMATITSCKKNDGGELPPAEPTGKLEKLQEVDLNVTEPSGLSFGPGGNTLLIISDNTNKVYETDLHGQVIRELEYTGSDLEGVAYNAAQQIVAVTEERKREIVFLDYPNGAEIERHHIETGGNTDNKGLEGLSYNPNNSAWYMVNEDVPGEMIVWNKNFENISVTPLSFASDYSGIFVDTKNALLYIVSDESMSIYKCDYNANVLKAYPLPATKFEGIAVDTGKQQAYLVNDKTGKLFIFKLLN